MVVGIFNRTVRRFAAWPLMAVSVAIVTLPSAARAQISLFNSNGFETPTFVTGNFASYYNGGTGGQQGFITTDPNQLVGFPAAGTIQTGTAQAGSQAFQVNGPLLLDDQSFGPGQTFWFRNYPTAGTAFNPVGSGTPLVRVSYDQRVTSAPLNLNEMPFVGVYMEGYSQVGSAQHSLGVMQFNQNGGLTALTAGGLSVATANGLVSHDAWHHFQVDFNFSSQTFRTFLDGNLVTFGASITDIPFRTNGLDRIAEYGFLASYQEGTGLSATNSAFFDNYSVVATSVPEPSSLILGGAALAGLGAVRRWRRR